MAGRSGRLNDKGYFEKIIYMSSTKENNFKPSFPAKHADLIYICSPNNPTGAALTKAELKSWVEYALENKSIILYLSTIISNLFKIFIPFLHNFFTVGFNKCQQFS